jgi:hypothetical protein
MNLLGVSITDPKGEKFAEATLNFMRERLIKYQTETGNHYNYGSHSCRGTSYRLARKDREQFGEEIICANPGSKHPYYTNSTHVPVGYTDDIFEVLEKHRYPSDPLHREARWCICFWVRPSRTPTSSKRLVNTDFRELPSAVFLAGTRPSRCAQTTAT